MIAILFLEEIFDPCLLIFPRWLHLGKKTEIWDKFTVRFRLSKMNFRVFLIEDKKKCKNKREFNNNNLLTLFTNSKLRKCNDNLYKLLRCLLISIYTVNKTHQKLISYDYYGCLLSVKVFWDISHRPRVEATPQVT